MSSSSEVDLLMPMNRVFRQRNVQKWVTQSSVERVSVNRRKRVCRHVCTVCTELQNTVNHELLMMNEIVVRNM